MSMASVTDVFPQHRYRSTEVPEYRSTGRSQRESIASRQYCTVAYGGPAADSLLTLPVIALYVIVSRGIGGSFALQGRSQGIAVAG